MSELQSLEEELADATRRRPFASLGLAVFFGLLSLVFSTWAEASLLMVPLVMIPSTIVQLVRLVVMV